MTKHLSSSNLSALDTFWQRWPAEAGTPKQRRIRLRLYMVYLRIRHGGLRLSEALNVNDNRDLVRRPRPAASKKNWGAREFSATHGASNFWKEASPSPSFRNTLAWPALFRPYA